MRLFCPEGLRWSCVRDRGEAGAGLTQGAEGAEPRQRAVACHVQVKEKEPGEEERLSWQKEARKGTLPSPRKV